MDRGSRKEANLLHSFILLDSSQFSVMSAAIGHKHFKHMLAASSSQHDVFAMIMIGLFVLVVPTIAFTILVAMFTSTYERLLAISSRLSAHHRSVFMLRLSDSDKTKSKIFEDWAEQERRAIDDYINICAKEKQDLGSEDLLKFLLGEGLSRVRNLQRSTRQVKSQIQHVFVTGSCGPDPVQIARDPKLARKIRQAGGMQR